MFSVVSFIFGFLSKKPISSSKLLALSQGKLKNGTVRQVLSGPSSGQLKDMVRSVVPQLHHGMHKGQAGRIAVIGGCQEYTGAPYFAAISALKVGADLSHVFCTKGASPVIKSYSPELIVHPILDSDNFLADMGNWLNRFHVLVIGPGMGREETIMIKVSKLIQIARGASLPMVLDADGLYLLTEDPADIVMSSIRGQSNVILTPNAIEFNRLYKKVCRADPAPDGMIENVKQLSQLLGHVTIVLKGQYDIISNGHEVIVCNDPSSARRCGGQGDLLSGSLGTFFHWTQMTKENKDTHPLVLKYGEALCAAYGACCLTRMCNLIAYQSHSRSMTTSDMIVQIHTAFDRLFT